MKNALFLTGAAARISQEVAIVDKLIEKHGLEISPDNTLLAGFSSGALNTMAINACFRKESPLSWDDYFKKQVLFNVRTKKVFKKKKFIPLNTEPLKNTISNFLNDAGYKNLEDLEFESYILAFSYMRLSTLWTSNLYNRHKRIRMLDIMMATTAIPIVFPDQQIRTNDEFQRRFTRGRFADGGTGGSFKRFEYYLKKYVKQNEQFDKLYIISPMREVTDDDFNEFYKMIPRVELFKMELKDIRVIKAFLEMISQNGFDTFIKRFYRWTLKKKIANEIYICIPAMEKNFPILDFDHQQEQYESVIKWANEKPDELAIPIGEYIKRFEKKPLRLLHHQLTRTIRHRILSFFIREK